MERALKASDSVRTTLVLKPIAVGFVLGFMLVGAVRLQPEQQAPGSTDSSTLQTFTGEPSLRMSAVSSSTGPATAVG